MALYTVADPAFASETSGPMGYMRDYAQHVKAEVTAGLNETETLSLLKSAADAFVNRFSVAIIAPMLP